MDIGGSLVGILGWGRRTIGDISRTIGGIPGQVQRKLGDIFQSSAPQTENSKSQMRLQELRSQCNNDPGQPCGPAPSTIER